jgi:hypothetical protein
MIAGKGQNLPGYFFHHAFYQLVIELQVMPLNDSLTTDERLVLQCWLDNGAGNN